VTGGADACMVDACGDMELPDPSTANVEEDEDDGKSGGEVLLD